MRAEHERSQSIYRYPDGGVIRLEYKKRGKGLGYAKHPRYRLVKQRNMKLKIQLKVRLGKWRIT
ncbi:hypothetical protein CN582_05285 [Bacillus wiedmannii]|uniref:hypothetical protein n=1 Tax=Bacillus TaxID=1386 RepID=UPI000BF6EE58|nr:hypothetical protein [Bacillus wiedmannii]PEP23606.1 hypothetical protein CN580_13655 [Bacillus wiedmannii]PEP99670.1 hypothetical protein CN582_05285 [Bacillus wiedmannii]PFY73004.1 hypothetical protein COL61_11415 [Bacillus wiedmannii]PHF08438.1 hypothetical protein COF74_13585 [Bacillus wiedmannii]PHF96562.1 hypothetical protein COI45_03400 [Bacillus wiedmannii]